MFNRIIKNILDSQIIIIVYMVSLTIIGLISLSSVSHHQELRLFATSVFKQSIWVIPSIFMFLIMFSLTRKNIYRFTNFAYAGIILLLIIPYFMAPVAGTNRWIAIGGINFQPSEIAKFIIVLALAKHLSNPQVKLDRFSAVVVPILITAVPALIVLQQPDLGTAIIMATPVIIMMYWSGIRPYHLFILIAPLFSILTAFHSISFGAWAVVLLAVLYLSRPTLIIGVAIYFGNIFLGLLAPTLWNSLHSYQQQRILTVFDPSLDPLGAGYQIIQSQTAIGSGGFFGKGWAQGTQTQLKYLPVQETDFIVSVIGEEFGFIMIFVIIVLFALLLIKMLNTAQESDNRFSSLVIVGVTTLFLAHIFVNMAMAIGLIPVKGLPLPFISYGGSFLLSCYMMIGLVMNLGINYKE